MKKNLLYSLLIFTALCCTSKKDSYPVLAYNEVVDFGVIKLGDTVNKSITVKNTSSTDLIIKKISSSCGCTVAKLEDSIVKPNKTTSIKVQFIADNKMKGRVKKSIVMDSNVESNFTVFYLQGIIE